MAIVVYIVVTIFLPQVLLIYSLIKKEWLAFILGVAAFTISQVLLRLPLLTFMSETSVSYNMLQFTNPILMIAFLALTAGLFEETARWIAMRYVLTMRTLKKGIIFGLGHGGIEAFILLGIPIIIQFNAIQATPDIYYYLGAFERVCAITIHVCLSIIVLNSVRYGQLKLYILAIMLHSTINFSIGLAAQALNPIMTELVLALMTIILVIYSIYMSRRYLQKYEESHVIVS